MASENELFGYTGAQKELLQILADSEGLERLRSLDTIADFLSSWSYYENKILTMHLVEHYLS